MAIGIKQQQKLKQQLVMTPQVQQSIKLLQEPRLELAQFIRDELEQNPLLEEIEPEPAPPKGEMPPPASLAVEESPGAARTRTEVETIAGPEWRDYIDAREPGGFAGPQAAEERRGTAEVGADASSLQEHLRAQLPMASWSEVEQRVLGWIIGNLDEDGYLEVSIEEIVQATGASHALAERMLKQVQALDPAGVAARDLRECLLIQLRRMGKEDTPAARLVEDAFECLHSQGHAGIARRTGLAPEQIAEAQRCIRELEPRPARAFGGEAPVYITPDVFVIEEQGEFRVVLNNDDVPQLRIQSSYRNMLSDSENLPQDARDYVQERLRSALWLIRSIQQRQETIRKVVESIVRRQRAFFEQGALHLEPLTLRDVADDIGMHESTVSRVTASKYMQTPYGLLPFKYFFNPGLQRRGGGAVSSESVREKIRAMIAGEAPQAPLSDQRIAELLGEQGIDIARRTVAKYREALRILSSAKRRQVG